MPDPSSSSSSSLARGNFTHRCIATEQTLKFVGLPLLSAAVTFVLLNVAASVVSDLSRSMQGESVAVPWPVCIVSSVAVTTFAPWLVSLRLLRQPPMRIYFLVCLTVATVIWYFVGFEGLLRKAYRRGL